MDSFSMVEATGIYKFKINHSETKDMGIGERITSPKFRVGQHDWAIKYFPRGNNKRDNYGQYVSVFLELQRESVNVRATFKFALLDKHGNVSPTTLKESSAHTFTSCEIDWGFSSFFERTKLEETYIIDDCFVLYVSITIGDGSRNDLFPHYHSPQSVQHFKTVGNASSMCFLHESIKKFRKENKQTDVSFVVNDKIFVAHRLILASQSPVFEAELFGSMAESNLDSIRISEIMPSVFKAMLDFMYNGSLTVNEELVECEEPMSSTTFLQHLLAVADRYAVDKLKATCEYELVESLSLDTVLSTLELAEKHNCRELKKTCLRFIVEKNNSISLMFSEGYIKLMQNYPSLLVELKNLAGK